MEQDKEKWSFSKILRILFPEIQLIDFIQQHGWRGKKRIPMQAQQTYAQRMGQPAVSPEFAYSPNSMSSVKEVVMDAKRGIKNLTLNRSPEDLDRLFAEIQNECNQQVWGQERFIHHLITAYKKAFLAGDQKKIQNSILITGPAGTGKKRALSILVDQLYKKRLVTYDRFVVLDLSRYSEQDIHTNFIVDCTSAFQDGTGTVCFTGIESAHSEVVQLISKLFNEGSFRTSAGIYVDASGYFLISYLDQDVQIEEPIEHLPSVITKKIPPSLLKGIKDFAITTPLTLELLEKLVQEKLTQCSAKLAKQTQVFLTFEQNLFRQMAEKILPTKRYGEAVDEFVERDFAQVILDLRAKGELQPNQRVLIRFEQDALFAVTSNQQIPLKAISMNLTENLEDLLAELDQLTGLSSVKTFIHELMETVRVQQLRDASGQQIVPMSLHMVFTGNPGTGKTTVARLISRILRAMGLLSQGQMIEVTRQDLVGQYVGSTAPKTFEKITMAQGGVLFIDEAYTLARGQHDIFGREAIDTLVKGMEDHRENLVVILAGYTKEMESFFKVNSGLQSRFPLIVEFPDYTPEEMLEILEKMAHGRDYQIDPDAREDLLELFANKQIPGRNDSGNGRLVRNLFEEAIRKQSARLSNEQAKSSEWKILRAVDFGINQRNSFNLEVELSRIIGLENIKAFMKSLEKQILANKRRKEAGIVVDTGQTLNMVFTGNPGTGKTTVARLVAKMLQSMGLLRKGHLVEVDRSSLVSEYVGQTAIKTKEVVESALGGVLFIDEAYSLIEEGVKGGFGKEAIDTLVRLIELHKDHLVVILAGYTEEMKEFMRVNPGLTSRFPLKLEFPDYTPEQMVQITEQMAQAKGFTLAPEIYERLAEWFEQKQIPGKKDSGNGRLVRNTLEEAIRNQSARIADETDLPIEQMTLLTSQDFQLNPVVLEKKPLDELEYIIGLENVKEFVRSLAAQIEVAKRRKALGLPDSGSQTLHMVFKGNPGTGKTTIARILAKLFKELGVVKSGHLVETDRSGLVTGYVGQTALKTTKVIEEALGGVLFIDEAYALASGGSHDFGQEAIDTLVKAMDDYRDRLVVILAGYDQDMERFLDTNAGLRSRFPHLISFPDYSAEEMLAISQQILESKGYKVAEKAEQKMLSIFYRVSGDASAGNGRFVRNLCEQAIRQHAVRVSKISDASIEQLMTIEAEDIEWRDL